VLDFLESIPFELWCEIVICLFGKCHLLELQIEKSIIKYESKEAYGFLHGSFCNV